MYGKKIFLVFALFSLLGDALFGDDFTIEDINGVWMENNFFELSLNNRQTREMNTFILMDNRFIIFWDDAAKKGVFQTGTQRNRLLNVEVAGKRIVIKFKPGLLREDTFEQEIILEYVSRDLFRFLASPFSSNPDYLCRISDFAKKPQAEGRIDNYGVRFRNRPELTSGVWFNLDFGEKVGILGISPEKQIIGELEAYWYEVRVLYDEMTGDSLDGWVFGAYLDVENREELEEKLQKLRRDGG